MEVEDPGSGSLFGENIAAWRQLPQELLAKCRLRPGSASLQGSPPSHVVPAQLAFSPDSIPIEEYEIEEGDSLQVRDNCLAELEEQNCDEEEGQMSQTLASTPSTEYVDAPLEELIPRRPLSWLRDVADRARDLCSAASLLSPPTASVPSGSSRTARHRWVPSQGLDAREEIWHELPRPLARRPQTSLGRARSAQTRPGTFPLRPQTVEPGELLSCLNKAPLALSQPKGSRCSSRRTPALSPSLATSEAVALAEASVSPAWAAVLPKSSSSSGRVLHRGFTSQLQSGVAGSMKPRVLQSLAAPKNGHGVAQLAAYGVPAKRRR